MKLSSKFLLMLLMVIWGVFSAWLVAVTKFPLNFGVMGLESLAAIVLIWTMSKYREI
jgi:hypothetical protein